MGKDAKYSRKSTTRGYALALADLGNASGRLVGAVKWESR